MHTALLLAKCAFARVCVFSFGGELHLKGNGVMSRRSVEFAAGDRINHAKLIKKFN